MTKWKQIVFLFLLCKQTTVAGDNVTNLEFSSSDRFTEAVTTESLNEDETSTEDLKTKPSRHIENTISSLIDIYGNGSVFFLGIFGNIASIAVLMRKRLREMPTSIYLIALSISDFITSVLGLGGRHWIRALTGNDPLTGSVWYCKFWYLFVPTFVLYSDWTLAAVAVERYIGVCFPLKAMTIVSRKYGKIYLVCSFFAIMLYYTYGLVFYELQMTQRGLQCSLNPEQNPFFILKFRPWLEFCLSTMGPATIIMICNICITVSLWRNSQKMKKSKQNTKANDRVSSMTGMLLTVTFAFVLLTTPFRVAFILNTVFSPIYWGSQSKLAAQNRLLWSVAIFCRYLNHSVNFLLYFLAGGEFRREFRSMICGKTPNRQRGGGSRSGINESQVTSF